MVTPQVPNRQCQKENGKTKEVQKIFSVEYTPTYSIIGGSGTPIVDEMRNTIKVADVCQCSNTVKNEETREDREQKCNNRVLRQPGAKARQCCKTTGKQQ